MVAIVSGNGLGLLNSSRSDLGQRGVFGNASTGQSGEGAFLNIANGNLTLQERDDFLAAAGISQNLTRTYNSQGQYTFSQNGANWHGGLNKQVIYNGGDDTVIRTDADGSTSLYVFDSASSSYLSHDGAGNTKSLKLAAGIWTWRDNAKDANGPYETYDAATGRIASAGDQTGVRLRYQYDGAGTLSQIDSVTSGERTNFIYENNNLVRIDVTAKAAGNVLRTYSRVKYEYDSLNRLASVAIDLSADDGVFGTDTYTTRYTYDGDSDRVASVTQDDGSKLVIGYTGVPADAPTDWKVSTLTDALGRTTRIRYDDGQTTVTDPLGNDTTYRYDTQGRLTEVAGPDVNGAASGGVQRLRYAYDANGNVRTIDDGQGHVTTFVYDAQDNCVSQRDQAGNTITRTYSASNKLLTETRYLQPDTGAGTGSLPAATTRYIYDSTNRLHYTLTAEGRVTEYRYGGLEKDQVASQIQYNATFYNVTAMAATATPTEAQLNTWAATAANRAKAGLIEYGYDARGLLITTKTFEAVTTALAGSGIARVTTFAYDRAGQLLKRIDANLNATSYVYDGIGRLIATTDPLNNTVATTFDYTGTGTTSSAQLYAGTPTAGLKVGAASTTTYDLAGQLVASGMKTDTASTVTKFSYDAAGRLRMSENAVGQRQYWLYDAAGRKTASVDAVGTLTEYVYNDAGELVRTTTYATRVRAALLTDESGNPSAVAVADLRPAPTNDDRSEWRYYDGAGRLATQVDAAGYVTRQVHDGASRVVQVTRYAIAVDTARLGLNAPTPVQSEDDRVERFFYDGDGNVTGKLDADGYLSENRYDGGGRLRETIAYATATKTVERAAGSLAALRPGETAADIRQRLFYNGANQLIATLDGDNFLTDSTYDLAGNLAVRTRYATAVVLAAGADLPGTRTTNAEDRVTTYSYTKDNRLLQEKAPDGTITRYTYDPAGNVTLVQRAYGVAADARDSTIRYDAFGRVVAELGAEGSALLAAPPAGMTTEDIWAAHAVRYAYDAQGRRVSVTDQNGHTTRFYYDDAGRLAATVNAAGEVERRTYDVFGQLSSRTTFANRLSTDGLTGGAYDQAMARALENLAAPGADSTISYQYNRKGQVAEVLDAVGYTTRSTYNAFGDVLLSERQDTAKLGYIANGYQYDHRGNLVLTVPFQTAALATKVEYDGFGRAIRRIDANGNATTIGYDHLGHVVSLQSAASPAALTTYDAFGRVLTERDSVGSTTTYVYNTAARSLTVTTPEGVRKTTTQNRYGQTVSIADATGTVAYAYDRDGKLISVTDALGTVQSNTYDRAGLQLTSKDANGVVTSYSFDAANRILSRTVDPAGLNLTTTYAYDTAGRATLVTDPLGNTVKTSYDQAGRVRSIEAADGGTTSFTYDSQGNKLTQTTPDGVTTQYFYDQRGYASHVIVEGLRTDVIYDKTGKNLLLRSTNQQQSIRYAYDANNRLVWEIDPAGSVTGYAYDGEGRLIRTTRYATSSPLITSSTAWNATFDAATIAATVAADSARDQTIRTFYDKDGRVYAQVDATGTATVYRAYDAAGRPTDVATYATAVTIATNETTASLQSKIAPLSASNAKRVMSFYDVRGHVTATLTGTVFNAAASTPAQQWAVQSYAYDGNGNVTATTGYTTTWESSAPTAAALKTWMATAANNKAADVSVAMFYDSANRLTRTATAQSGTGAARTWSMSFLSYDQAGNVIERRGAATLFVGAAPTAADFGRIAPSNSDSIVRYKYDALGRLTFTAVAQGIAANGEPQWAITRRILSEMGLTLEVIQYAALHTGDPAQAAMAPPGIADRVTRNSYDHSGRVVTTVSAENEVMRYVYDARGNAVQRIDYGKSDAVPASLDNWIPATDPGDLRITRTVFDLKDRPVLQIDALGYVTENRYDALGNVTASTLYAAPLTPGEIAQLGPVPSERDVRDRLNVDVTKDRTTRNIHDGDGRIRYTIDAAGYITENVYDALGRITSRLAYQNAKTLADAGLAAAVATEAAAQASTARKSSYSYDQQGNLITSTDATGAVETYTYDGAGRRLTYRDQLGNVWSYTYDAAGRKTRETSPQVAVYANALGTTMGTWGTGTLQSLVTQYTYDAFGNLNAMTEAAGTAMQRTIEYAYDLQGRLTKTTLPSIKVYDPAQDPLSSGSGVGAYEKDSGPRTVETTYNAFGNAVTTKDVGGVLSYRIHDKLGRVTAEVDGLGYVTTYERNAFGEIAALTRHAQGIGAGLQVLSQSDLALVLKQDPSADRTILTEYDKLGRAILVREPVVEVYDPQALGHSALIHAGKATRTTYNAYGQIASRSVYGADLLGKQVTDAAVTRYYYDNRGNTTARIDALADNAQAQRGYLSTFTYDAAGNALTKTEYSTAITGWSDTEWATPVVNAALDRRTSYTYDACNHKLTETQVGVTYHDNTAAAAAVTGDVKTTYTYNKRGERTSVTDALNARTYTYFDALGRITGTASVQAAAVAGIAGAGSRLVEHKRDIRGNIVLTIEYAQGATGTPTVASATAASLTDVNNRVTATAYNIDGNAVQVLDPEQFSKPAAARSAGNVSYDAFGRAVKQWRSVTNGSVAQTSYEVTRYDAAGRVAETIKPNDRLSGSTTLQDRVSYTYNSFGELTATSMGDFYRYDLAGNAWLSNAGGIDKVALHDVMGQVTVAIQSTSTVDRHELRGLQTAADALSLHGVLRTDTRYDLLGHQIDVSQTTGNHAEFLQSVNGIWTKTASTINKTSAGSLLIIGRPDDTGKTFSVRYRRLSDTAWFDAAEASIAWVDGYPTFNTAGLDGGDYLYEVYAQPVGEPPYQAATGTLSIATRQTMLAQAQQVIALYLMVASRAPTQAEIDAALRNLDAGRTLPQLASTLLASQSGLGFLSGATPVEKYFADVLHRNVNDSATAHQVQEIARKLNLADRDAWYNGEAVVELLAASTPILNRRAAALLNYLVIEGGSSAATAERLLADAEVVPDGAIAAGTSAARAERQRDQVVGLYLAVFGRIPSKQDTDAWVAALRTGTATLSQIAQGLVSTLPPSADVAEPSQRQLFTALFANLIGRPATEGELAALLVRPDAAAGAGDFVVTYVSEVAGYLGTDADMVHARTQLFDKVKLAQAYWTLTPNADEEAMDVGSAYIDSVVAASAVALSASATALLLYQQLTNAQRAIDAAAAAAGPASVPLLRVRAAELYVTLLGRAPETRELDAAVAKLQEPGDAELRFVGSLLDQAAAIGGATFKANLTDREFAAALYVALHGTPPTSQLLDTWATVAGATSRAACVSRMLDALLLSGSQTSGARSLLVNKAAVAVTYATSLSSGDQRLGADILTRVTETDIGAALAYAQAIREERDSALKGFNDPAAYLASVLPQYAALRGAGIQQMPPMAQAMFLYVALLDRYNNVTPSELASMIATIKTSGLKAAVKQLLDSQEAIARYGAEMTDPDGTAFAQHLHQTMMGNPFGPQYGLPDTLQSDSISYWAHFLRDDREAAVIAMLSSDILFTPMLPADPLARAEAIAQFGSSYTGTMWSLAGMTTPRTDEWQAAIDSVGWVHTQRQHAVYAEQQLSNAISAYPEVKLHLDILQALVPLPGIGITKTLLADIVGRTASGVTLAAAINELLLSNVKFNPNGVSLSAAVASVPRAFAEELYARLHPASAAGTDDTHAIDSLWTRLRETDDIGRLLIELTTPALGGKTPDEAEVSFASAEFIANQVRDTAMGLWGNMTWQAAARADLDKQLPTTATPLTLLFAVQIALRGQPSLADMLRTGDVEIGKDPVAFAEDLLRDQLVMERIGHPRGETEFVRAIYAALSWSASTEAIDRKADLLKQGASLAAVTVEIIKDVLGYNGADIALQTRRQLLITDVHDAIESDLATLNLFNEQFGAAGGVAQDVANLPITSADIPLLSIDVSSLHGTVTGAQPKITVDRWGNILTVSDARDPNWKISYTYNYRNEQLDQTSNTLIGTASAARTEQRYDAVGRLVLTRDANGNVNRLGYDSNGNVVTETHADGGVVTSTYNLFGERLSVQQPATAIAGVKRTYTYDHLGNLKTTSTDAVTVYVASEPAAGAMTVSSSVKALVDSFTYDELGRKISTTDASGAVSKVFYDLSGNVVRTVDALGFESNSTYDAMRRLVKQTDANGKQQSWTYDEDGRLTESTDMAGTVTRYSYNAAGQLTQQTSSKGQDIRYTYSGIQRTRIDDVATGLTTEYTYDANGNRLSERQSYAAHVTSRPEHVQNNTLTYDMQNRLATIQDDQYKLTYSYDKNGNRTQMRTEYDDVIFDAFNTYDVMNRQLIVNGEMDNNGKITLGQYGHELTYDKAGNRTSDRYYGVSITKASNGAYVTTADQYTIERYTFDAAGRLSTITRDALLVDTRHYDAAGRTTESGFLGTKGNTAAVNNSIVTAAAMIGLAAEARVSTFDKNGRTISQLSKNLSDVGTSYLRYTAPDANTGYDNVGNVLGYTVTNLMAGTADQYTFEYDARTSYGEKNVRLNNQSSTTSTYDVNGQRTGLEKVELWSGATRTTEFWYDAEGHIQTRKEGDDTTFSLIVNGNVLGNETKTRENIIGQNYVSATSAVYSAAPSVYTAQEGDTLRTIAQRLWGDSSLWYVIADANGIPATEGLLAGRTLKIPPQITTLHNDYGTFKPYNASSATGDTSPLGAPGNAEDCGAMGGIVTAAIAVAASYISSGLLNAKAVAYLSRELGGLEAADRAMATAALTSSAMVSKLMNLSGGEYRAIATEFLQGVLSNDGSATAVQADFSSYGSGLSFNAATARALMVHAANNGAQINNGLQSAFDWGAIARAEAAKAAQIAAARRANRRAAAAAQAAAAARAALNTAAEADARAAALAAQQAQSAEAVAAAQQAEQIVDQASAQTNPQITGTPSSPSTNGHFEPTPDIRGSVGQGDIGYVNEVNSAYANDMRSNYNNYLDKISSEAQLNYLSEHPSANEQELQAAYSKAWNDYQTNNPFENGLDFAYFNSMGDEADRMLDFTQAATGEFASQFRDSLPDPGPEKKPNVEAVPLEGEKKPDDLSQPEEIDWSYGWTPPPISATPDLSESEWDEIAADMFSDAQSIASANGGGAKPSTTVSVFDLSGMGSSFSSLAAPVASVLAPEQPYKIADSSMAVAANLSYVGPNGETANVGPARAAVDSNFFDWSKGALSSTADSAAQWGLQRDDVIGTVVFHAAAAAAVGIDLSYPGSLQQATAAVAGGAVVGRIANVGIGYANTLPYLGETLPQITSRVLGRAEQLGANSSMPHGFASMVEFAQFGSNLRTGLGRAGYENAEPILQGSAVTGKSFKTGQPFDVGRVSDFDVALADPTLLSRAQELGIGLRSGGTRTGALSARDLRALGLRDLSSQMGQQAGREVNFMIYNNPATAAQRAPSVVIPGKR